jgi:Zn-dependent protease/CBS domain-containing protein
MPESAQRSPVRPAGRAGGSRWSFQIGTMLGIPIRIHVTFVLILVWFGMAAAASSRNVPRELFFVLAIFGCVVLHELGHAAMARRFGVTTHEIVLYPIGGVARLDRMPGGWAEFLIALAGPAVNVVLAVLLAGLLALLRMPLSFRPETLTANTGIVPKLLVVNVMLVVFNLIPAFPMDGGRVLRGVLAVVIGQYRATRIAAVVGQIIAGLFVLGGLFGPVLNPWLIVIGLFVFLGATQEAAFQTSRSAVAGHTAREAMITRFETLAPQETLARAAELLLATHQHDFPVIDAWGRVAGILPRATLLEALARAGGMTPVLDVMLRDPVTIPPGTDLDTALQHLQASPSRPLLVLENDKLVGMLTFENLAEFIVIAQRLPGR